MIKVEAIIRPDRVDDVKAALDGLGAKGMTVTRVMGAGKQRGQTQYYRGQEHHVMLLDKVKLETVVLAQMADAVVQAILDCASTGEIGDGKVFLSKVDDAIRIRTGERGRTAIG